MKSQKAGLMVYSHNLYLNYHYLYYVTSFFEKPLFDFLMGPNDHYLPVVRRRLVPNPERRYRPRNIPASNI